MERDERDEAWAVLKIQTKWRGRQAPTTLLDVARRVWEMGFHLESGRYFYFNKNTGESQWTPPKLLKSLPPYRVDFQATRAAVRMQSAFRSKLAKKITFKQVSELYRKEYDPETKRVYYLNKKTSEAKWDTNFGGPHDMEVGEDSRLLMRKDDEIETLKKQLEEKEMEIKRIRDAKYEDLAEEVRFQRIADALKGKKRSRHCEEWQTEHVVSWFMDMDLDEYVPALVKSKVNGLLLLNMDDGDFEELGILKKIHLKKITIALRKYKRRYEARQQGEDDDEDDEDFLDDDDDDDGYSDDESEDLPAPRADEELREGDDQLPTEEEVLELQRDRENLDIEVVFPGDEKTFPEIGDIICCHFVCKLADDSDDSDTDEDESSRLKRMKKKKKDEEKMIDLENTRKKKQPFEFVLGIGQVIKGIDRAVLQMSYGERSKITVSPAYAYAQTGMPPLIPPNAALLFDIELLRWRSRPHWVKPLIQPPGFTEFPYEDPPPDDDPRLFILA